MPDTQPVESFVEEAERRLRAAVGRINEAVDAMPYVDLHEPASWKVFLDALTALNSAYVEARMSVVVDFKTIMDALQ